LRARIGRIFGLSVCSIHNVPKPIDQDALDLQVSFFREILHIHLVLALPMQIHLGARFDEGFEPFSLPAGDAFGEVGATGGILTRVALLRLCL